MRKIIMKEEKETTEEKDNIKFYISGLKYIAIT
jgi:hypothetical protein